MVNFSLVVWNRSWSEIPKSFLAFGFKASWNSNQIWKSTRKDNEQSLSCSWTEHSHMVSKDRVGLIKWATLWKLKELQLLSEIKEIAPSPQSSLIGTEAISNLFEFYAKNIFSLPVNHVLAERHFNLSQLYLNDNRSELSKHASVTFVEKILRSGKTNNRTTEVSHEVHKERMKENAQLLTTDFLQEARENFNKIRENSTHFQQWMFTLKLG